MILQAGSFIENSLLPSGGRSFFEKQKNLSSFHSLGEGSQIPSFMGDFFHNLELIKGHYIHIYIHTHIYKILPQKMTHTTRLRFSSLLTAHMPSQHRRDRLPPEDSRSPRWCEPRIATWEHPLGFFRDVTAVFKYMAWIIPVDVSSSDHPHW